MVGMYHSITVCITHVCIRFLKSDVYKDCIRAEMSGAGTSHAVSEQNLVSQDTAVAQNLVTNNR